MEFHEDSTKRIRRLLNKITPASYDDLMPDFLDIIQLYSDNESIEIFASIMFNMAISDPRYSVMYADLAKIYCDKHQDFKRVLIQKCLKTFDYGVEYAKKTSNVVEARCVDYEDEERVKHKMKMRGFIGEMYRHNLIADAETQRCLDQLFEEYEDSKNELFIDYTVRLIESLGVNHEKRVLSHPSGSEIMSSYLNQQIDRLDSTKTLFSTRIKFMVLNLTDLRRNGWVDRRELATIIMPRMIRDTRRRR